MARPHHRKKHKQHVRQFKHSQESTATVKAKARASGVFAFGGAIAGLLLTYLASNGSLVWAVAGLVTGGVAGYLAGKRIDRSSS